MKRHALVQHIQRQRQLIQRMTAHQPLVRHVTGNIQLPAALGLPAATPAPLYRAPLAYAQSQTPATSATALTDDSFSSPTAQPVIDRTEIKAPLATEPELLRRPIKNKPEEQNSVQPVQPLMKTAHEEKGQAQRTIPHVVQRVSMPIVSASQPIQRQANEVPVSETRPVQQQANEVPVSEMQPIQRQAAQTTGTEAQPVQSQVVKATTMETPPVQQEPTQTTGIEAQPAQQEPTETVITETPPVQLQSTTVVQEKRQEPANRITLPAKSEGARPRPRRARIEEQPLQLKTDGTRLEVPRHTEAAQPTRGEEQKSQAQIEADALFTGGDSNRTPQDWLTMLMRSEAAKKDNQPTVATSSPSPSLELTAQLQPQQQSVPEQHQAQSAQPATAQLTHVVRQREARFVPPVVHSTGRHVTAAIQRKRASVQPVPVQHQSMAEQPLQLKTAHSDGSLVAPQRSMPVIVASEQTSKTEQANGNISRSTAPSTSTSWGNLPAPWEPLPDWLAIPSSTIETTPSVFNPQAPSYEAREWRSSDSAVETQKSTDTGIRTSSSSSGEPIQRASIASNQGIIQRASIANNQGVVQHAGIASNQGTTQSASNQEPTGVHEGAQGTQQPASTSVHVPEPDMDELARQVYAALKRRLGVERRRMG